MAAGDEEELASVAKFSNGAELACHPEHEVLTFYVGAVKHRALNMDGVSTRADQCPVVSERICEHKEAQSVAKALSPSLANICCLLQ